MQTYAAGLYIIAAFIAVWNHVYSYSACCPYVVFVANLTHILTLWSLQHYICKTVQTCASDYSMKEFQCACRFVRQAHTEIYNKVGKQFPIFWL